MLYTLNLHNVMCQLLLLKKIIYFAHKYTIWSWLVGSSNPPLQQDIWGLSWGTRNYERGRGTEGSLTHLPGLGWLKYGRCWNCWAEHPYMVSLFILGSEGASPGWVLQGVKKAHSLPPTPTVFYNGNLDLTSKREVEGHSEEEKMGWKISWPIFGKHNLPQARTQN